MTILLESTQNLRLYAADSGSCSNVNSSSHVTQKWSAFSRHCVSSVEKEHWGKIKLGRDSEETPRWLRKWKIKPLKKDERNYLQPLKEETWQ